MHIQTIKYHDYIESIPKSGRHILAQQNENEILVYQAFNERIANYAVANQTFGGNHYKMERMSWIKPNFLWMMYRSGWAEKKDQERILAIWMDKRFFDKILKSAVFTSFKQEFYESQDDWKAKMKQSDVRLQWDPDHDIYGNKQTRKAIQLGLKGSFLKTFVKDQIIRIEDITEFVRKQKERIQERNLELLEIPIETAYIPNDVEIRRQIGLEN